jgi:ATP-binding cassette subfamily B multidrug efflux pump
MESTTPSACASFGERPIVRLLRRYAWPYRFSYLAGGLFLLLTNYLSVSIPGQIGSAVDALRAQQPIGRFALAIAMMGLIIILVRSLSRILIFNPGRHLEYRVRQDLFAHLLRLQPAYYVHHRRGDIVSRAANDIQWIRVMVGYGGLQVVNVTMAVVLTGWKMVGVSPRLTVMTLIPVLVGMSLVQWGIRRLFHLARRNQEQVGMMSDHVLGSLQGMAAIQGFVAEKSFAARFEEKNAEWLSTGMRLAMVRALALPLVALSGGISVFVLLGLGGSMVVRGTLGVGELVTFAALLTVVLPPLRSLGWMLSVMQRGRAALERIFELLDAPIDRPEGNSGVRPAAGDGPAIELRRLSFAFPDDPDNTVLDDVSASIPAGSVVGLFGRTGSGKSTLLSLLGRLYNPPADSVLVDGVDITEMDLDAWRDRLAVVPQRPFLFSDTISYNVSLEEAPDQEAVEAAVSRAALDGDVEVLPDGLGTVVGERGIMLSGGQRQRVALARGLFRGGDVLILDDVLSAVDHQTEVELVDMLARLSGEPGAPTVFIASHRLSALHRADLILVLERGHLVDLGTHRELVSRPGPYRETWEAQEEGAAASAAEAAS